VHVAQQGQRLCCKDTGVGVGGAWTHQQTLRHLCESHSGTGGVRETAGGQRHAGSDGGEDINSQ
jgi:hypothetical protein